MRSLRILDTFRNDFRQIDRWYRGQSVIAADRLLAEVQQVLEHLPFAPEIYPIVTDSLRRVPRVGVFPYAIFYRVLPDTIDVVGIMHHKRHPQAWENYQPYDA